MNMYIAIVFRDSANAALSKYEAMLADGYEERFALYAKYIKKLVPDRLKGYMMANASHSFTCYEKSKTHCCQGCGSHEGMLIFT